MRQNVSFFNAHLKQNKINLLKQKEFEKKNDAE